MLPPYGIFCSSVNNRGVPRLCFFGLAGCVELLRAFSNTATAEVVRAVGAQGTIIGPTHAISAAFTSIKGAARRARRASPATHGDGNGVPGVEIDITGPVAPESSSIGRGLEGGTGVTTNGALEAEGSRARGDKNGDVISGGGKTQASVDTRHRYGQGGEGQLYGTVTGGHESIFGEEVRRYGDVLDALMREAVSVSFLIRRVASSFFLLSAL